VGTIFTKVTTETGNMPVKGTLVLVCHYDGDDEDSGEKNLGRCWEEETDRFGEAKFEISVAESDWKDKIQHFMVTPVPRPVGGDCVWDTSAIATYNSSFLPLNSTVAVEHMLSQMVEFQDKSQFVVFGEVVFDPLLVRGSRCPVAGATVTVAQGGQERRHTTDAMGLFQFAAPVGMLVEMSVEYGGETGAHTFNQASQMLQMGVGDVHFSFFDTTKRLLNMTVIDESHTYPFTSVDLEWAISSETCTPMLKYFERGMVFRELPALPYEVELKQAPNFTVTDDERGNFGSNGQYEVVCSNRSSIPVMVSK
jgi:hypothetical protein